jgi:galactokinase
VGVNCGILDQYTSVLGQAGCALMLDCRSLTRQPVPIHDGICVVICDTKAKRDLTGSEYPERRSQCEAGAMQLARIYPDVKALRDVTLEQLMAHEKVLPPTVAKRCRFIVEENDRVLRMARALPAGDRAAIRTLTAASYEGAHDLYEIISPPMSAMMTAMQTAPGVIGARQAGAGFGGCMVAFVEGHLTDDFGSSAQQTYARLTGIQAGVYAVQAVFGAGPLL